MTCVPVTRLLFSEIEVLLKDFKGLGTRESNHYRGGRWTRNHESRSIYFRFNLQWGKGYTPKFIFSVLKKLWGGKFPDPGTGEGNLVSSLRHPPRLLRDPEDFTSVCVGASEVYRSSSSPKTSWGALGRVQWTSTVHECERVGTLTSDHGSVGSGPWCVDSLLRRSTKVPGQSPVRSVSRKTYSGDTRATRDILKDRVYQTLVLFCGRRDVVSPSPVKVSGIIRVGRCGDSRCKELEQVSGVRGR